MKRTILTFVTLLVLIALAPGLQPQQFMFDGTNADASSSQAGTAQVVTEDVAGLHRVIITTPQRNKIFVNLPDDMAEGDTISGTVFAEAAGKTAAERTANLLELKDRSIEVLGKTVSATGGQFEFKVPASAGMITTNNRAATGTCIMYLPWGAVLDLESATTGVPRGFMSGLHLPGPITLNNGCIAIPDLSTWEPSLLRSAIKAHVLPTYGQAGRFIEIRGPFNGILAPTDYVRIGRQEMKLLAESPRHTIFFNTSAAMGQTEIELSEGGQVQKAPFRNVTLIMSALKYSLRRGERTKLHLVVKGLDNLLEDIPLCVENRSTSILTMEHGNVQTITIHPKDVKSGGVFETDRTLTGIQPGDFVIEGVVTWNRK